MKFEMNRKFIDNKMFRKKGFTLIEVMLAISILTIAVGGSFALIQQTLIAASLNQSELAASYLMQEGIEIVRNIRDNNWLEQRTVPGTSWDDGLTSCQSPDYCCEGDYKTDVPPIFSSLTSFSTCGFNNLHYLNIDENGFYGYSEGAPTKFKRKINVTKVDNNTLEVSIEVQWSERGRDHSIKAQDYLYNWYGY